MRFRKPVHEHFLCGTVGDNMQKPVKLLRLKERERSRQKEQIKCEVVGA
jgi:hypothetical protein